MAERISPYRRPFRVVFIGDETECAKWLPWAKNKLFLYRRVLGKVWRKVLLPKPDVRVIITRVSSEIDSIIIEAGGFVIVSGLAYVEDAPYPLHYDDSTKKFGFHVAYPRKLRDGITTFGPWMDEPQLIGCFHETKGSLKNSRNDLTPGFYTVGYSGDERMRESPIYRSAGKYSGELRKVVQCLIGMGHPIEFDYRWARTHGIMTCSDGSKWVIEISAANGVRAAKMPIARRVPKNPKTNSEVIFKEIVDDLGYVPVYRGIDKIFDPSRTIALIPPGHQSITEVYTKFCYANNLGWAFSYTGAESQVTCYNEENRGGLVNYAVGFRYKLTITESENRPVAASIVEVEHGYLWGDHVVHFKYWDEDKNSLVSFDLGGAGGAGAPTDGPMDMSFYVYYDGDSEVVCRYSNPNQPAGLVGADNDISPVYPIAQSNEVPPPYSVGQVNESVWPSKVYRKFGSKYETPARAVYIQGKTVASFTDTRNIGARVTHLRWDPLKDGPVLTTYGISSVQRMYRSIARYDLAVYDNATESVSKQTVIIIPGYDRECCYLYTLDIDTVTSDNWWTAYQELLAGDNVMMDGPLTVPAGSFRSVRAPDTGFIADDGFYITFNSYIGTGILEFKTEPGAFLYAGPKDTSDFVETANFQSPISNDTSLQHINSRESLTCFGSLGREKVIFSGVPVFAEPTVYQAFVDGEQQTQHMYVQPDAFGRFSFASAEMEGNTGSGLVPTSSVGEYDYQSTVIQNSFFYGKP
jgi:hypothetical protein